MGTIEWSHMCQTRLFGSLEGFGVTGPNSILSSLSLATSEPKGIGASNLRSGESGVSSVSLFCALASGDDSGV